MSHCETQHGLKPKSQKTFWAHVSGEQLSVCDWAPCWSLVTRSYDTSITVNKTLRFLLFCTVLHSALSALIIFQLNKTVSRVVQSSYEYIQDKLEHRWARPYLLSNWCQKENLMYPSCKFKTTTPSSTCSHAHQQEKNFHEVTFRFINMQAVNVSTDKSKRSTS